MKIGVSSYSYSQLLNSGKYTQLDLIAIAKEMGFDGIEFTDLEPPAGVSEKDYAASLAAESKRCGLPIISYTIGADLLNATNLDDEVARLCNKVDVAAILGAPCLRHDATGGYRGSEKSYLGFEQALPAIVKGYKAVTQYAAKLSITTMIENHGFFCQESSRVERIITGVGDPNFGALVDIGNFACADESSPNAVGRLAPFAKHVHAKDFHIKSGNEFNPGEGFFTSRGGTYLRGAIIGQGNIPVAHCLAILKRASYDGWVSVEFEGMEDARKGIAIGLANLRKIIASL